MASFPNTVFSPATRSAGQQIGSAHMNDVQNEIVAIEDGLRSGTAPLNSSNSTFNTVTVSSLFSAPGQPRCGVYSTSVSTVTSTGIAAFNFTSQDFSVGGMHSTGVNSSAVTIASSGTYLLNANVIKQGGGSTTGSVYILVNNNDVANHFFPSAAITSIHLTRVTRLQSSDVVTFGVLTTDTSGTVFGNGSPGGGPRLDVVRLY